MSIDDLLQQISEEMMLPSVTAEEPTKIKFGGGITFKEVHWYKASLPKINTTVKGKEPLVEEIKGNPAKEMFTLICTDVDFLVQIREEVVEEKSSFFYSFSLCSLSALQSVSDLAKNEEQLFAYKADGETEATQIGQSCSKELMYRVKGFIPDFILASSLPAGFQTRFLGTPFVVIVAQNIELRIWSLYFSVIMSWIKCEVAVCVNFRVWLMLHMFYVVCFVNCCIHAYSIQLLQPCLVVVSLFLTGMRGRAAILHSHLPAGICFPGYSTGRGVGPSGGAPGGAYSVPVM
ncbi:hypothetical protein F511_16969 [Dorcoceras hygrometricum]|uniref:Uncharacterized protein n=1 Tax=Dorcoceras hygrometricum TaxID=472368 RepID=A0A2Z7AD58_9LAMI|nr:hypothetical protein F511_16969 [Dorcoceras hygrometricum]